MSQRSREAIRVDGATWRWLRRSPDDRCSDCGACDAGSADHQHHRCSLSSAWFAGNVVVCSACFAARIQADLGTVEVELVGVAEEAARGDHGALERLLHHLEERDGDTTAGPAPAAS